MKVNIKGITKRYKDKTVVQIENHEFTFGKIHAILGANGAGKTTLLRILAGVEKKDTGSIQYNNQYMIDYTKISYMPQQTYLFDTTVIKNVTIGMVKTEDSKRKARKALEYVGMSEFENKKATELSGGESQRVAIARLLARDRELVLLDEPSSATDIVGNELIADYIKRVNNNGKTTIVFITHNPAMAVKIADECIFMVDGKIIEAGRSSDVIYESKSQEMRSFLENWRI